MLSESIKKLVQYGIETGLTPACEKNYTTNLLLDVFKEDEYTEPAEEYSDINLDEVLKELLDEAVERLSLIHIFTWKQQEKSFL